MPFELSGGEQQRLIIARALLNFPDIILADEPTANLDPMTADEIMQLFHKISIGGTAVIMATHNLSLIEKYPSRTLNFTQNSIHEVDIDKIAASKSSI
jgi:cell division transport system ATP-binding protein